MRIFNIELENIKSYERARVDFTDGVNAIMGHNGSGKSTLLEAVGFALFTATAYTATNFLREGCKQGSVAVTFESIFDGRTYKAVRRVGSVSKQAIFDPDLGVNVAEGAADVQRFLHIHMGLQPTADLARIFRDAVGVPQGTLTAVFLDSAAHRKPIFDPLLQAEEYQTAFVRLLEVKNLLQQRATDAARAIAHLDGLLAVLPGLQQRAANAVAELATAEERLAAAQAELAHAQAQQQQMEAQRAALAAAEQAHESARSAFTTAQAALQFAQKLLADAQSAQAALQADLPGHDRYLEAQRSKQALQARQHDRQQAQLAQQQAAAALALAEQQARQAAADLAQIADAEALALRLAAPAARQAELEEQRSAAQADQGAHAGATAALEQAERTLAQEQARLAELHSAHARVADIEAQLLLVQGALVETNRAKEALTEQRTQKTAEGLAYKTQIENLEQVEGAVCPVCEGPLTPAHRAEMVARNHALMEGLRGNLRTIAGATSALQEQLEAQERARRSHEEMLRKLPSAATVEEQERRLARSRALRDEAAARVQATAGAAATLAAIQQELAGLGNPAQQIAVARAAVTKRPALEAAQRQATAAAAAAAQQQSALAAQIEKFATLDADLAAVALAEQVNFAAYQAVLANRQAAAALDARTLAAQSAMAEVEARAQQMAAAAAAAQSAAAAFDAPAYASVQAETARLLGEVGSLRQQRAMLTRERDTLAIEIDALRVHEEQLAAMRATHADLQAQTTALEKLRNVIKQAGPFVTATMIHRVSVSAAQIFGELTGDFSRILHWGEDYDITLEVDGRRRDFAAFSGGEQMMAALAVRLALLRAISGISVAFFDEPTAHLDGQRREALATQILSFMGGQREVQDDAPPDTPRAQPALRQLFVISHDDTFEHATSNVIHLKRVNGVSRVDDGVDE